jgi:hypothetical protein
MYLKKVHLIKIGPSMYQVLITSQGSWHSIVHFALDLGMSFELMS